MMSCNNNQSTSMLKVRFGDEIRKIPFEGTNFEALVATIKKMFGFNVSDNLSIRYVDEDKDLITLSSDLELQDAIKLSKGRTSLDLSITVHSAMATLSPASSNATPASVQPQAVMPTSFPLVLLTEARSPSINGNGMECDDRKERRCARRSEWKEKKCAWKEAKKQMREEHTGELQQTKEALRELREKMHALRDQLKQQKREFRRCPKEGMNLARVLEDVTIPDDTIIPAGQKFIKTWRFKNEANKAWPSGSKLILGRHSDAMGAPESIPINVEVQPQQEVDVSIPLQAPLQQGRHTAAFRLVGPKGRKFGQRVWVQIMVQA